jgi:hypothetical protein
VRGSLRVKCGTQADRTFTRLSLALFASVLLAFVAVIFDLAQLLARGGASRAVSGTDPSIVQGFVAVRELCLALSLSLRFTWFSAFIVRTPRGLEPQEGVSTNSSNPGPFSWRRVGVAGLVIKWILLVTVATLFGLQVTWRMVQGFSYSGPVYFTSVGLEFVLVVIIGGKAIVNFVVAKRDQRWSLLRSYAIPLLALILEFVVAAGDLGVFPFSETVLGRFLQGVEMYLLLLWTMANAFKRNAGPMLRIPDEPPTLPMDLPRRQSTLRLSLHNITPHSRQASQHEPVSIQEKRAQRGRASVASRSSLTSWVGNRRILRSQAPYHNDDERLWVQDQAEQGFSPAVADDEKSFHRISEEQLPVTEAPVRSKWDDAMLTALSESPEQVDDLRVFEAQSFALSVVNTPTGPENPLRNDYEFQPSAPASSFARSASPSIQWKVEVHPPAGDLPPAKHDSSLIVPTLSDTDHEGSSESPDVLVPPRALGATVPDSPVYGLEGISRPPLEKSSTGSRSNFMHMSTTSSLTSRTDIEEVLRRQQELDRSIQKLNITSSSTRSSIVNEQVSQPSRISSISGVSLAQFPAPPWVRRSLMTNSRSSLRRSRSIQFAVEAPISTTRRRSASIDSVDLLQPPQMPATLSERHVSVPETLRDSVSELNVEEGSISRSPRFESQGTEYVITSFIGGKCLWFHGNIVRLTQPR